MSNFLYIWCRMMKKSCKYYIYIVEPERVSYVVELPEDPKNLLGIMCSDDPTLAHLFYFPGVPEVIISGLKDLGLDARLGYVR